MRASTLICIPMQSLAADAAQPTTEIVLTGSLSYPLDKQGIATSAKVFANLGTAPLVEPAGTRPGQRTISGTRCPPS